jgi:hypothetical protein
LKADKVTMVFEAIGDDKVRVTCPSWDDAKVILAVEGLEVVGMGKTLGVTRTERPAQYLNIDPSGLADAGYAGCRLLQVVPPGLTFRSKPRSPPAGAFPLQYTADEGHGLVAGLAFQNGGPDLTLALVTTIALVNVFLVAVLLAMTWRK